MSDSKPKEEITKTFTEAHKRASRELSMAIAKLVLGEAEKKGEVDPEFVVSLATALIDGARMVTGTVPHLPSREALRKALAERALVPFKGLTGE